MKQGHPGTRPEIPTSISRWVKRYRAGLMGAGLLAAVFLPPAVVFGSEQDAKVKKSATLSEEDKEIIKDLELLENLTLLQDLDAIDFLDILNEMNPDWAEETQPADRTEKKEGGVKK
jgi:hypothetical protein